MVLFARPLYNLYKYTQRYNVFGRLVPSEGDSRVCMEGGSDPAQVGPLGVETIGGSGTKYIISTNYNMKFTTSTEYTKRGKIKRKEKGKREKRKKREKMRERKKK